jgi:lysophospholipase L1-like esterase
MDAEASPPGQPPRNAPTFNGQTVRQILRLSLGGDALRIKVTNLFGTTPLTISGMRVARSTGGSSIDVSTDFAVTFSGQDSVTVPAGTELYSDAVPFGTAPLTDIAITMYFAGPTTVRTLHGIAMETPYVSYGDQRSQQTLTNAMADPTGPYYALASVETSSSQPAKVVVAFGDSQTDGIGSTVDANKRYPNQLDARLKAAGFSRTGVVNEGLGGNRWINDFTGPSGTNRLDRDLLNVPGVTHAILLEGINDIGFSVDPTPTQVVSADQINSAIANAVARAKSRGIKVIVGTLLPFQGTGYFSADGETKRQAVNAFIRSGGTGADAVVDFDALMRDPSNPAALNPAYDSGDHLHPNDTGYGVMAGAIDLSLLQ